MLKEKDILRAMNEIDDDLISEASPSSWYREKKRVPVWNWRNVVSFASVVLIAFLVLPVLSQRKSADNEAADYAQFEPVPSSEQAYAISEKKASDEETVYQLNNGEHLITITVSPSVPANTEESVDAEIQDEPSGYTYDVTEDGTKYHIESPVPLDDEMVSFLLDLIR